MSKANKRCQRQWPSKGIWLLSVLAMGIAGCEVDSWMNPATLGRWERTPVVLPILDQLDIIDEPKAEPAGMTDVMAEDLIPEVREYVVGPGDVLSIRIFELMQPNADSMEVRRVDPLGNVRLPLIGPVKVTGLTASQLEETLADHLIRKQILKADPPPTVTVLVQSQQQRTYTIIGEPRQSGTAVGVFVIPKANFRLLDAMAIARGAAGRTKYVYVIRQVPLTEEPPEAVSPDEDLPVRPGQLDPLRNPADLLDAALDQPLSDKSDEKPQPQKPAAPEVLDRTLDRGEHGNQWIYVGDKWIQTQAAGAVQTSNLGEAAELFTQRIIRVPYQELREGHLQYNVVIRPGDIISVPTLAVGSVYIMGAIARPGTYFLPGEKDLTLKAMIASAGGLNPLAIPERVDLIRRVGENLEATVRLDVRAIFEGRQPDFFLKRNDLINIGTSFVSVPLAVLRNGFRMTYGFGFILDRNFADAVYSPTIARRFDPD